MEAEAKEKKKQNSNILTSSRVNGIRDAWSHAQVSEPACRLGRVSLALLRDKQAREIKAGDLQEGKHTSANEHMRRLESRSCKQAGSVVWVIKGDYPSPEK
jgi:hypothetical protein